MLVAHGPRYFLLTAAATTAACLLLPASAAGAARVRSQPAGVIGVGVAAIAIAVDPVTDTGYSWGEKYGDPVNVIDLATGTVTASITVPDQPEIVRQVLAVDPDTNTLYLSNFDDDSVLVIDGATNTVTQTITGLVHPTAIAVDPATDTVYVAQDEQGIAVIDGATGAVTGTVPAGLVTSLAVDPSTDTIYAGEPLESTIMVIDGATGTVAARIADSLLVSGLADDPATDTLYAANGALVTAYSGSTNAATGNVSVKDGSLGIAVDPATDTVFAADPDANLIVLISGSAGKVTGSLALTDANQVAVDPTTDTLLAVANDEAYVAALHAPAITRTSATFTVGKQQSVTITATGTPAPAFTESGKLPAGLKLKSGGTLTGKPGPGTAGTYKISVTAANGVAPAATKTFRIVVKPAAAVTTPGT
jgi:YVTN family beta-propeller protein